MQISNCFWQITKRNNAKEKVLCQLTNILFILYLFPLPSDFSIFNYIQICLPNKQVSMKTFLNTKPCFRGSWDLASDDTASFLYGENKPIYVIKNCNGNTLLNN